MTRLPAPGSDDGHWGDILNEFLSVEHNADGTLKKAADIANAQIKADAAIPLAQKGAASGVAALDAGSKLDTSNLPSSVVQVSGGTAAQYLMRDSGNSPSWIDGPYFNAKAYGAKGDGITDDAAAINAAVSAASAAGGGTVFLPPGTYMISGSVAMKSNTTLAGAGRIASTIKKSTNIPMVTFWGSDTDNRCRYAGIRDVRLHGNDLTGTLIDCVYADNVFIENVFGWGNPDIAVDLVETWDSRLLNNVFEWCSGTATSQPAIYIRNSRAASGFGFSTDNSNQIHLIGNRIESWHGGAIRINSGTSNSNNPNGIYMFGNKAESYSISGPALAIGNTVKHVVVDGFYCWMGGLNTGASSQHAIDANSADACEIRNVFIGNANTNTVWRGVALWAGGSVSLDNIIGVYGTAPGSGNHVEITGGGNYNIGEIRTNLGTAIAGIAAGSVLNNRPIRAVAGPVSDASFPAAPPIGTLAVDTTNSKLYIKTAAATWKSVTLA